MAPCFEDFLQADESYRAEISQSARAKDNERFEAFKEEFRSCRTNVQEWILENASNRSHCSGVSKCSQSSLVKEELRKAELLARYATLEDRKLLERSALEHKLKEDELNLKIEMAVSEAKCQVLGNLESDFDIQSSLGLPSVRSKMDPPNPLPRVKEKPVPLPRVTVKENSVPIVALEAVTHELRKPIAELTKFNGNPMEYRRFKRQFQVRVCDLTDSYEERLNFLYQFTEGEAHRIVKGYLHLDSKVGYLAVLDEFETRYGDAGSVAQAYVQRALNWPPVKADSAKALDEFSIFLRECLFAVEAAEVLNYSENLKLLVKKLPYFLHDKWRTIVLDTRDKGHPVQFKQLVELLKKEARKAMDPVYGKDVMSSLPGQQLQLQHKKTEKRKIFSTRVSEDTSKQTETASSQVKSGPKNLLSVKPCAFCNGFSHCLDTCPEFAKLVLKDRYQFLKSKGACFGCFRLGHQRSVCRNKLICEHCGRCHPSVMHVESSHHSGLNATSGLTFAATRHSDMGAGDQRRAALAIVPVRVKVRSSEKFIQTYAFLDSGSSASFCSESIMKSLGVEGRKTKINLCTMGQESVVDSYVVSDLEVISLDGMETVQLPPVFTQLKLPVSRKDVVTSDDIGKSFQYLSHVPLKSIESEVGLLIGVNVPQVMQSQLG